MSTMRTGVSPTLLVPADSVRYAEFRVIVEPTSVSGRSQLLPFVAFDYGKAIWTSIAEIKLRPSQSVVIPFHVTLENSGPDVLTNVALSISTLTGTGYVAMGVSAISQDAEPHDAYESAVLRLANPGSVRVTLLTPTAEVIDRWGKVVGRVPNFHLMTLGDVGHSVSANIQDLSPGDGKRRTINYSVRLSRP